MSATLSPTPRLQFFTAGGIPLVGGHLYTYAAGTNTPLATYTGSDGVTQNPVDIVLDARGETPNGVWLNGSVYKFVLADAAATPVVIWTVDNISTEYNLLAYEAAIAAPSGSSLVGFQQQGSSVTTETVQSKLYESVSVVDFGAMGDGSTDDTVAIQAALNASRSVYFPVPSVSYYITSPLLPQANGLLYGDGATTWIQLKDGSINGVYGYAVDGVTIRGLKFSTKVQNNETAYKAAVFAELCSNWLIEDITAFNLCFWGVALKNSSSCIVRACRFSTWFGTLQDSADIAVYHSSNYNLIDGNFCYGTGADHGIFVQDPYLNTTPTGNTIINNVVGGNHKANGIAAYVTTAYDNKTIISGNHVRDVQGTALAGLSGAGIYVQSTGGTIVTNNVVENCCVQTTNFSTQAVGHISVSTGNTTLYPTGNITPVIVANNSINAPRGPGIYVATCATPVNVAGNNIWSSGTTAVERGESIFAVNADGVNITNNIIHHQNTNFPAINCQTSLITVSNVNISDNQVQVVGATTGINTDAPTGTLTNVTVSNNRVWGGSGIAGYFTKAANLLCSNNSFESTGVAFTLTNCVKARLSNNRMQSTLGTYSIIFTGAAAGNAGMVVDSTNNLDGIVEHDAGTGGVIQQYGNAAPATAIWAVGDQVIQSVPVVGQPKGWRCTVAGNPGTWVSEGNL